MPFADRSDRSVDEVLDPGLYRQVGDGDPEAFLVRVGQSEFRPLSRACLHAEDAVRAVHPAPDRVLVRECPPDEFDPGVAQRDGPRRSRIAHDRAYRPAPLRHGVHDRSALLASRAEHKDGGFMLGHRDAPL
jgi:hypothetical protein